ncbi:uncharacterized protein MONOS_14933 [Monocercomonoides exilis]|uniref:uncharacterized protein n=1 Tax=Monocercomonoides exilis TaxID=2049356 RepID=UPI00355A27E9|nr:hypothetical protein MONOS_14933 [Monocercomonoides exilis]|eukprot:MONOS_14933.1-p1 / transcript=MONOS_14933.1 / gene=MONOS_14933 / organism=Monocercomonoides_exilis_PA203 / gene_product=unspecified product / transcript_product=unspecified product / location=Mono_scaffold01108:14134-15136(+) / protein_length=118 / sequence_SO=supercontig / SO=protein_coding / is_pseudo=false
MEMRCSTESLESALNTMMRETSPKVDSLMWESLRIKAWRTQKQEAEILAMSRAMAVLWYVTCENEAAELAKANEQKATSAVPEFKENWRERDESVEEVDGADIWRKDGDKKTVMLMQ